MNKLKIYLPVILLIVLVGIRFGTGRFNEHPSHIHAWAESDRIALAHGFVDNNLNFFQPQTYTMNHQYPSFFYEQQATSRTSVDFPIHDFVPAVIMKMSGSKDIRIFQTYVLLYSFIGMFFLFRLSELFVKNPFISFGIVFFAITSPIFIYYQGGFLPTIPSLSNAIIGLFYYFKYRQSKEGKHFAWFIFFLTLSALARTTFAIPLIALCGIEVLSLLRRKAFSNWKKRLFYFVISFAIIGGYFLYNSWLRAEYGSMFLNSFIPAKNWEEIQVVWLNIVESWGFHYFSYWQYIFVLFLLGCGILAWGIRRKKLNPEKQHLLFFLLIYLIGCVSFSLLLIHQFPQHDYYFLDTYFLWILLLVIFFVSSVPKFKKRNLNALYLIPTIAFAIPIFSNAPKTQNDRKTIYFWSKGHFAMQNYINSADFLDSLGIEKEAIVLQLDATSPNGQLTQMERKGVVAMHKKKEHLNAMLSWNYDYVVCQNDELFTSIFFTFPEILGQLECIGNNGKISVFKKKAFEPTTLKKFLGIENRSPLKQLALNSSHVNDSSTCVVISKNDLYNLSVSDTSTNYLNDTDKFTYVAFDIRRTDSEELSQQSVYFVSDFEEINRYVRQVTFDVGGTSKRLEFVMQIPIDVPEKGSYGMYFLNHNQFEFEVDNFVFEVYER